MPPKPNPFKLATSCQNQIMAAYQVKIRQQAQFLSLVRAALVPALAEQLLHCVVSGKKLLLYTETEEWAAQLRFHQPLILEAVRQSSLAAVNVIQVRIIPQATKPPVIRNANLPSKQNIELIRENLQSLKDDELKLALLRLTRTLDRLS